MKNERENNSSINLTATDGKPAVSFAGPAGGASVMLTSEPFRIAGNEFTAYYDGDHKLVFVLDQTLDDRKPNVLLVINSIGDRKWDDILANDHYVDLETVRPKVDNKYQKLDIEYSGLSIYNKLINEFKAGTDLDPVLTELSDFRTTTIRRAAADRLDAASEAISRTRETISKTGETMRELQAHLKKLREKLSRQKKEIGKEPTKQSAAKILKTESQIDTTNEKLHRAKRRLVNAQRRLTAVEEDADIARRILEQQGQTTNNSVAVLKKQEVIEPKYITEEPKAEDMADEKIKPLFNKDPEILDEKIAFKPIDFNMPVAVVSEPKLQPEQFIVQDAAYVEEVLAPPAPLLFTPPVMKTKADVIEDDDTPSVVSESFFSPITDVADQTPVLNTITSVNAPEPVVVEEVFNANMNNTEPVIPEIIRPIPVIETVTAQPVADNMVQAAPIASGDRPVSPISGSIAPVSVSRSKPTALYYIMLVALIVLSIVTLWLYQRNTANNVPDLTAPAKTMVVDDVSVPTPMTPQTESISNPFIQVELSAEPEPVTVPAPQMMPVPETQPMVDVEMMAEPEPVVYDDVPTETVVETMSLESAIAEPVYQEAAQIVAPAQVAQKPIEKPAYNVSQQDKMFVASSDYEAEETYYDDAGYEPQPDDNSVQANEYY